MKIPMEISFAFSLISICEIAISSAITVDDTGIEPVTPSMSRKCATAAL
ncbi:MAG: hypothetical protein RLZZ478_483, partial [Actinomycetota bacterium]